MLSIGLIGCGAVVHNNYAATLRGRDDYEVRWVCDTDPVQAASAASLFGAQQSSLNEIARQADVVIITTPPSSHYQLISSCMRAGRVILCEKPFTVSSSEAATLCAEAEATGTLLRVGQFRRTFPQLRLARDLISTGAIGFVSEFAASEGGRFTWRAVSDYPVRDPNGGVLWDTGSHTVDMALFASGLDRSPALTVQDISVVRDKPEPSHHFSATFTVQAETRLVAGKICLSRRDVLPNVVSVKGDRGTISFSIDLDDRVRLTTDSGSTVFRATESYVDLMECFDLQLRRVLLTQDDDDFDSRRFIGQVGLLEALANA